MEPWLQYATTTDGVSIAYTVAGAADPLVRITGGLWDHAQGYWRIPPMRRQLERIAERFTHIQYDARGTGLSQRGVADFRLEAQLLDLEAVIAANKVERFDLLGHFTGGFAAMSYAALHPERVSRLVLFRPHLRGEDYFGSTSIRAMAGYRQMAAEDWLGYLNTVANRTFRFEHPEFARLLAAVYNESMTPETIHLFEEQYRHVDVSDVPEKVQCPTLIIVETGFGGGTEAWRDVAAMIPNMSLQMVRANMPLAFMDEATDAILSFLGEETAATMLPAAAEAMQVTVAIVVPGPKADYQAALTERVRAHGALRFEETDAGFLASFRSAQMALETAIDLQQSFHGRGRAEGMCIGVDALDPAVERRAPGGRSEQVSRLAVEGQVLVTDLVRQLVTGKGYRFEGHSSALQANGDEPLHVFELKWGDE